MQWDDAVTYCQKIGGSAVTIETYVEEYVMPNITSSSMSQLWLGIKRNETSGLFYNVDGQRVYLYYWLPGEPSSNGDCVSYRSIGTPGMQIIPCYSLQPALCRQMPALCPTQTQYGGAYTRSGTISSPGWP